MNAHSVRKNNYLVNEKDSRIFTPEPICEWIREILEPELKGVNVVFDPAVGTGNLLKPFKDRVTIGNDTHDYTGPELNFFYKSDFLEWEKGDYQIDMVICNPPYNHNKGTREKYGRGSLLPELFADKVFRIFGNKIKFILFVPMGVRLNQRCYTKGQGKRYRNIRDNWPGITSIATLPLDCFQNPNFNTKQPEQRRNPKKGCLKSNIQRIETHQEILFFNMPKIKPHLMLPDNVIDKLRNYDYAD